METRTYTVVGVTFENRQDTLERFYSRYIVGKMYPVFLEKEKDNPYDSNAVSVNLEIDGAVEKIGYISKNDNRLLNEEFDLIKNARLFSIGTNRKGDLGVTIEVEFDK